MNMNSEIQLHVGLLKKFKYEKSNTFIYALNWKLLILFVIQMKNLMSYY